MAFKDLVYASILTALRDVKIWGHHISQTPGNTMGVIHVSAWGWCRFEGLHFAVDLVMVSAVGCKQVWINMPEHKCSPDALSVDLTSFSASHPLCSAAMSCCFSRYSPPFPHLLLPTCLSLTLPPLHHAILFSSSVSQPSLAALLHTYQITWCLPMGNMINRLHFTAYQESRFHLPPASMGTQPFIFSSAVTAGGNPPGHLHVSIFRRTKKWAIHL